MAYVVDKTLTLRAPRAQTNPEKAERALSGQALVSATQARISGQPERKSSRTIDRLCRLFFTRQGDSEACWFCQFVLLVRERPPCAGSLVLARPKYVREGGVMSSLSFCQCQDRG